MPDQSGYWDRSAAKTFTHPLSDDFTAALEHSDRILDYGCGYGRSLRALAGLGFHNTVGVDFSREMVARGRRECPGLDLRHIDRPAIGEPDGSFDAAMILAVLTCIVDDDDQAAVLTEIRRLLRPGGLLFISDMPLQEDARNRARYDERPHGPYGVFDTGDGGIVRHHTDDHMQGWLSGFEPISRRRIRLTTMHGNPATGVHFLARRM
ncbi:class I SAM-dependent methyltransferase [Reyranella aquatilis]|jgi:SAM-dependent methyltransferase|uniref:Class I SAM-dependent methyltransferase n=1 Tax=Reyranella aquatilis TaxID=2035356 RepID=A0ABS8L1K0_9HYPH|nr:class I SAM-dependent methyltransferase [Reyranella aquatilis]MCC8431671.1 class I SAM-dependent methyltransferase [Reyranella aquatilis]